MLAPERPIVRYIGKGSDAGRPDLAPQLQLAAAETMLRRRVSTNSHLRTGTCSPAKRPRPMGVFNPWLWLFNPWLWLVSLLMWAVLIALLM